MRIRYFSDIHLEFDAFSDDFHGALRGNDKYDADVLVLAGDVTVKNDVRWIDLMAARYPHIVYVFGNHEYYGGRIDKVERVTREKLAHLDNVHVLQNESVTLNGITFHGTTLWTDCNKGDPLTMDTLRLRMNDYRRINYHNPNGSYHRFRPHNAMTEHLVAKLYLLDNVKKGDVVVTHMAPTFFSIHEQYKHDLKMNGGYASDLSELILDTQPALWVHGHIHNNSDYMVGDTRVLCNPRGYRGVEENADFDLYATIEI